MNDSARIDLLKSLGAALHHAFVDKTTIPPLSKRGDDLTIEEAYLIQTHMLSHRINAGVEILGKKIGATSEPVQKAVGIDQPDFGVLLSDTAYQSGDIIPYTSLIQPRAEGEVLFVLKHDLAGPGVTPEMVLEATEYVSPCLEIVDSRIHDWDINIIDTIADNASCGAFIQSNDKVDVAGIDLAACQMRMYRNGTQVTQGLGAASLGHPANAVAWLANKFGEIGETLRAGDPILSGSLGALIDVHQDDIIRLEIDGIGTCDAKFH